ncbi:sensor histidine kinase [Bifidobacterium eulemuris]|uniref:Histidine kinase n=2 Tax=Bifidobacterium eulemuris TaxID=1765219 RepID=A0A261GA76_9BIFI|nr:hypothetical protein [Bifidobacterium eulemuris]OZG68318.1 histidine kinase [Bifidobacterium eulemuris]QOL31632.1 hypothetical protein BE0216_03530 [Bifidobacterium eulemuris]
MGKGTLWALALALLGVQTLSAALAGFETWLSVAALIIFDILTLLIPAKPKAVCPLIAICWGLAQLLPRFDGAVYAITAYSAVSLLFANMPVAYPFGVLASTSLILAADYAVIAMRYPALSGEVLSSVLLAVLGLSVSAIVGLAIKQSHAVIDARRLKAELAVKQERLARLQRDAALASRLHDGLSNDLSYLLMHAANEMDNAESEQQRAAWRSVIDRVDKSFATTHTIIDVLRVSASARPTDEHPSDGTAGQTDHDGSIRTEAFIEQVNTAVARNTTELDGLGFHGSNSLTATRDRNALVDGSVADEALRLIDELFANIRRHCDTSEDYSCEIVIDGASIAITQMNTLRHSQHHAVIGPSGKGLDMHRSAAARFGGTLDTSHEDEVWITHVVLPLRPASSWRNTQPLHPPSS